MKKLIDLSGVVSKENGEEITEKEFDKFMDDFIELVEKSNFIYGGGFSLLTEKEYDKKT